jgi:hypothetical protein
MSFERRIFGPMPFAGIGLGRERMTREHEEAIRSGRDPVQRAWRAILIDAAAWQHGAGLTAQRGRGSVQRAWLAALSGAAA